MLEHVYHLSIKCRGLENNAILGISFGSNHILSGNLENIEPNTTYHQMTFYYQNNFVHFVIWNKFVYLMLFLGSKGNPVALVLSQSNALRQLLLSAHVDLTDGVVGVWKKWMCW